VRRIIVDLTLEDGNPVVGDDDELPPVVAGDVEESLVDLVVEIYRAIRSADHGSSWPSNGIKCTRTQVAWIQAPASATAAMTIA
jgi:hypothetical protein